MTASGFAASVLDEVRLREQNDPRSLYLQQVGEMNVVAAGRGGGSGYGSGGSTGSIGGMA
ncbi:MAG: hypothetical protein KJ732_07260 [Candidatus Margulisbacteria bacterium]|nr:hypothetical protein [Candidatus Margulisiibacteriota bacterium]